MILIIAALLSFLFAGCGVSQEEYDRVNTQLGASQEQVAELQSQLRASQEQVTELQDEYDRINAKLRASQAQIAELQDEYEIVGETPAETAENIVKRYHETHIYSKHDFFVCSDMALDVWNMLKAQGIDALIQIGNVKTVAEKITDVDHAWVLAETSPGNYLALETTGGYVVLGNDNPLYYKGWSFDNPREYKRFVELRLEYNIRVKIADRLTNEAQKTNEEYKRELDYYQELVNEFNRVYAGHPVSLGALTYKDKIEAQLAIAKEIEGRYNQLNELINEQQEEMETIASEMRGLTG